MNDSSRIEVSLFYKWWYLKRKKWNIHKCLRAPPTGGLMRTLVLWRGGRKLQREWRVVMKLNRWMNRWKFHSIPFFTSQRPIWPHIWSHICAYMGLYGTLQLLDRLEWSRSSKVNEFNSFILVLIYFVWFNLSFLLFERLKCEIVTF